MTDTPRTDAVHAELSRYKRNAGGDARTALNLARDLERELAAAQSALSEERKKRETMSQHVYRLDGEVNEHLRYAEYASELLRDASVALNDWTLTYARELCDAEAVDDAWKRIHAGGGTLAYIADLRAHIDAALAKKPRLGGNEAACENAIGTFEEWAKQRFPLHYPFVAQFGSGDWMREAFAAGQASRTGLSLGTKAESRGAPSRDVLCGGCAGSGAIQVYDSGSPDAHLIDVDCPKCGGVGVQSVESTRSGEIGPSQCPHDFRPAPFSEAGERVIGRRCFKCGAIENAQDSQR